MPDVEVTAYVTQDDLDLPEQDLIGLTDDDRSGAIDTDNLSAALEAASNRISLALRSRGYDLPLLAPIDPVLTDIGRDLAQYNLYSRRKQAPDLYKDRHRDALRLLEQIASGAMEITITETTAADEETAMPADVQWASDARDWTHKNSGVL